MTASGVAGWIGLGLFSVVVYVVVVLLLQRSFLYFPAREALPPAASVIPGAQDARITTADGNEIGAWFVPGRTGAAVLVHNGNAGHRGHRTALARALAREGFAVLLYDHPGYGDSGGAPSERSLLDAARAAAAYLAARPGVDPGRVAYFGESLGAAVAAALAAERPPAALILRSPFSSTAEIAGLHYPLLPLGPLLLDRHDVRSHVARVAAPVLVIAGERDRIVPAEHSRRVHDAAKGPKRFLLLAADHNDRAMLDGPELVSAVAAFLRESQAPATR